MAVVTAIAPVSVYATASVVTAGSLGLRAVARISVSAETAAEVDPAIEPIPTGVSFNTYHRVSRFYRPV